MIKLLYLIIVFILVSCTSTKTYIQNASISGIANTSPVRITDNLDSVSVVIRPFFIISDKGKIAINNGNHTKVNSDGIYQVDPVENENYYRESEGYNIYKYRGNNIIWTIPDQKIGVEAQLNLENIALIAGTSIAKTGNSQYWNVNAGLSCYRYYNWWAWRFDINFFLSKVTYDVYYLNRTETSDLIEVRFHHKKDNQDLLQPDFAFVLNTKKHTWPVNLFLALNVGKQTLFDIENKDSNGESVKYLDEYSILSFGFYRYVLKNCRAVFGYRWNYHPEKDGHINRFEYIFQIDILGLRSWNKSSSP